MSSLEQVISLLSNLQTQMQVAQSDLQRDINSLHQDIAILGKDVTSLRCDLDQKTNSLHQDIAILGQDVGQDVSSLQQDVKALQENVASLPPHDPTLKQAMVHNLDKLSHQFGGLVVDFQRLADSIHSNFDSWARVAHSRVIDKVLEIQRPRLKAIENQLHKNLCTCLHDNSPTSIPEATAQHSSRPGLRAKHPYIRRGRV
ncbi:hypothetical protein BDR06DRAFT_977837 [Suillus hirtellus]|nr:hypothetical protein BDR06DRAFT_977837 [Suillus hirtellus]